MKATRLYTLLALLLMAGGVTMQAQTFDVVCETGQTMRYTVTSQNPPEVELVQCLDNFVGGCTIPETVTYNGTDYSVVSIGYGAFYLGWGFFDGPLSFPNTLRTIGDVIFYHCHFTGPLVIPNSVESIGTRAFWGCDSFTSLTLSESLTEIKRETFALCSGFRGDLTIPASVEYIEEDAFAECGFDGTLTLSPNWNYIEAERFTECYNFTGIVIPEGIIGIATDAFTYLYKPTELTLPASLSWGGIEDRAFCHMRNLEQMTVRSITPPYIDMETFMQTNRDIPVYIPMGTIEAYRSAPYWSEFTNFIEVDFDGVDEQEDNVEMEVYPNPTRNLVQVVLPNEAEATEMELINMSGQVVATKTFSGMGGWMEMGDLPKGIYMLRIRNAEVCLTRKVLRE